MDKAERSAQHRGLGTRAPEHPPQGHGRRRHPGVLPPPAYEGLSAHGRMGVRLRSQKHGRHGQSFEEYYANPSLGAFGHQSRIAM